MSVHQQPELKAAILSLPDKEKDKLLLRLINKDKMLIKRLHFVLLENEEDLNLRIEEVTARLHDLFDDASKTLRNEPSLSSVNALRKLIRQANGLVNEHEKITKDKFSEVEFRIVILLEVIKRFPKVVAREDMQASKKLHQYLVARIKYIIVNTNKLHEDLKFDLRDKLQTILDFGFNDVLSSLLNQQQIPTQWN